MDNFFIFTFSKDLNFLFQYDYSSKNQSLNHNSDIEISPKYNKICKGGVIRVFEVSGK